ncbi:hypothetical protein Lal_00024689 [Lupinus albus]|nr:hypothetical protein Lal_00024689 [Lupinus albus]
MGEEVLISSGRFSMESSDSIAHGKSTFSGSSSSSSSSLSSCGTSNPCFNNCTSLRRFSLRVSAYVMQWRQ